MLEKLSLQMVKGNPVVKYGGEPLVHFKTDVLKQLMLDFGFQLTKKKVTRKKAKKKVVKKKAVKQKSDLECRALQLAKVYAKMKKTFYHRGDEVEEITEDHRQFSHFLKAATICERHGVHNYKTFLSAQIEGLKFINNGRGKFPTPPYFSTEQAETRLLDYLRDGAETSGGDIVRVNISKEEQSMSLSSNTKYKGRFYKVRDGVATLKEAVYVRELQMLKRGKVNPEVEEYIVKLTE